MESPSIKLIEPIKKTIGYQFFRFLGVGVLNTIFGYSVFLMMLLLGFHPSIALLIATIAGILFNFKSIGHLVFGDTSKNRLMPFIGQYVFLYILNWFLLQELMNQGMKPAIVQLILLLPIAVLSFTINKFIVFRKAT